MELFFLPTLLPQLTDSCQVLPCSRLLYKGIGFIGNASYQSYTNRMFLLPFFFFLNAEFICSSSLQVCNVTCTFFLLECKWSENRVLLQSVCKLLFHIHNCKTIPNGIFLCLLEKQIVSEGSVLPLLVNEGLLDHFPVCVIRILGTVVLKLTKVIKHWERVLFLAAWPWSCVAQVLSFQKFPHWHAFSPAEAEQINARITFALYLVQIKKHGIKRLVWPHC